MTYRQEIDNCQPLNFTGQSRSTPGASGNHAEIIAVSNVDGVHVMIDRAASRVRHDSSPTRVHVRLCIHVRWASGLLCRPVYNKNQATLIGPIKPFSLRAHCRETNVRRYHVTSPLNTFSFHTAVLLIMVNEYIMSSLNESCITSFGWRVEIRWAVTGDSWLRSV